MFCKCTIYYSRADFALAQGARLKDQYPEYQFGLCRTKDLEWWYIGYKPQDLLWLYSR